MKITLGKVRTRYQGLLNITGKNLPVKLSYAIAKNLKILEEEVKILEKQRVNIAEKYSVKDESGTPVIENEKYKMSEEDTDAFNKEYEELLEQDIEVNIHMVSSDIYDVLEDSRYDILTPGDMIILDFMVECQQENTIKEVEPKA